MWTPTQLWTLLSGHSRNPKRDPCLYENLVYDKARVSSSGGKAHNTIGGSGTIEYPFT